MAKLKKYAGEIYKEQVLARKDLNTLELPLFDEGCEIIKDLFGIKVIAGKDIIECSTDEEARYIKLFIDLGLHEVKIPKDLQFLKKVLAELEEAKSVIDERMDDYMLSILRKQDRARLKREVYADFAKYD